MCSSGLLEMSFAVTTRAGRLSKRLDRAVGDTRSCPPRGRNGIAPKEAFLCSARGDRIALLDCGLATGGGFCKRHLRSGRNDDDFLGRPAGGAARTHDNVLDLPASVYRAGFHLRASRRASVIWAWVICGSSSAHLEAARSSPRAAAKLYHM